MKFATGIEYIYQPLIVGKDRVGSDVTMTISTCQSFKTWYAENRDQETANLDTAGTDTASSKIANEFSNYSFSRNYDNDEVNLDHIKEFGANQIVLWHGHGGYNSKKGSYIISGEDLNEASFLWDPIYYIKNIKYTEDYVSGRIVISGYDKIAVTAAYIDKYCGDMTNSFFYLATCESGKSSKLADSFLNKNASAVIGNDNSINSKYNSKMQRDVVNGLISLDENGSYEVRINQSGYVQFSTNLNIVTNKKTYVENILMVDNSGSTGTIKGKIVNAVDGAPVSNVSLIFRSDWNNTTGLIMERTKTNSSGEYTITLPIGYYTAEMTCDDYITTSMNVISQSGSSDDQNGVIYTGSGNNIYRIVLTWEENPRDLDSHVTGTTGSGNNFHVYYNNKSGYDGDICVAFLDVDDTDSYGPETIRLNAADDIPYYYYVYKYAGSGTLASSNAKVEVYRGNELVRVYNVPTDQGGANYWNVFKLTNGTFEDINTISNTTSN